MKVFRTGEMYLVRAEAALQSGNLSLATDAGNSLLNLSPAAINYYLPIPQTEVLANPNIRPNNPGW